MYYTGNLFKSIPETQKLIFGFSNIYLSDTGVAEIGFSGAASSYSILFSGNKVYDSSRQYIYSTDERFDLSGIIEGDQSQIFINQTPLKIKSGQAIPYKNFFVKLNGTNLNADVFIYTPQIDYSIIINPSFSALGNLSVNIQNNSDLTFKVFDYSLQYTDNTSSLTMPQFSGVISGTVDSNSSSSFSLADVSYIQDPRTYAFDLVLNTNFGKIINSFSTLLTSGYNSVINLISKVGEDLTLPILFFGETGLNSFSFVSSPSDNFTSIQFGKYNLMDETYGTGECLVLLEPVYPSDGETLTSEYVTGILITNTGLYSSCPNPEFREYFYVSNLSLDSYTILSTGCTGRVNLNFSAVGGLGTGVSGYLLVSPYAQEEEIVYGSYGQPAYYLNVTGAALLDGGSGYIAAPLITLDFSEAGNDCYDFALASGNKFPYSAFSGTSITERSAGYMTGEVVCGSTGDNYYVSGIVLTNPGSGYSSTFLPKINFLRDPSDVETEDASAEVELNQKSTTYNFGSTWSIESGLSSEAISTAGVGKAFMSEDLLYPFLGESLSFAFIEEISSYSGRFNYSGLTQVYFKATLLPIDYTGVLVSKLRIINEDNTENDFYFSGTKVYSTDPNLLLNDVNYFDQSSSVLNFLNEGIT